MPFPFYDKLTPARQRIYRASDAIPRIDIANIRMMAPQVQQIERALSTANRAATEQACQALVNALNTQVKTPAVRVRVLERRPSDDYGELHGLYEPDNGGKVATVTIWMRTAQKDQVVKFRTFLRTLIHEMCHHFDYEHFRLAETFHTDGFYQRESVLLKELLGEPVTAVPTAPTGPASRAPRPGGRGAAGKPGGGKPAPGGVKKTANPALPRPAAAAPSAAKPATVVVKKPVRTPTESA
ncbi:MAG: hypothetical protein SF172_18560 [Burkholderiales bacterium]|nr:hypothetical protein [Burkholderiales bacterium]